MEMVPEKISRNALRGLPGGPAPEPITGGEEKKPEKTEVCSCCMKSQSRLIFYAGRRNCREDLREYVRLSSKERELATCSRNCE
jgi:hypothetical protein